MPVTVGESTSELTERGIAYLVPSHLDLVQYLVPSHLSHLSLH
jgi:hypothetical protein